MSFEFYSRLAELSQEIADKTFELKQLNAIADDPDADPCDQATAMPDDLFVLGQEIFRLQEELNELLANKHPLKDTKKFAIADEMTEYRDGAYVDGGSVPDQLSRFWDKAVQATARECLNVLETEYTIKGASQVITTMFKLNEE